jgi:iron complex transport system permease protein
MYKQKKSFLIFLVLLLPLVLLVSSAIGSINIPLSEIFAIFLGEDSKQKQVFLSLRLPRIFLAALVGAALGVSGASIQGLFRNPLAEPGLIGILAGAALAVAIVTVFGHNFPQYLQIYTTSIASFLGGIIACILVFRFAAFSGNSVAHMLLAGIAVNAISMAGVNFLIYSSNDQQMRALNFWLMGSFGGAVWTSVIACTVIVLPCIFFLNRKARDLNIMLLGEEEAHHLGVNSKKLKRHIIIFTALCTGVAVAVSGPIGFIGLIVPHLIRFLVGTDNRLVIPASALLGAILLVASDTIARTLISPAELPVGILTSLIGGPYFLFLLVKQYLRKA